MSRRRAAPWVGLVLGLVFLFWQARARLVTIRNVSDSEVYVEVRISDVGGGAKAAPGESTNLSLNGLVSSDSSLVVYLDGVRLTSCGYESKMSVASNYNVWLERSENGQWDGRCEASPWFSSLSATK